MQVKLASTSAMTAFQFTAARSVGLRATPARRSAWYPLMVLMKRAFVIPTLPNHVAGMLTLLAAAMAAAESSMASASTITSLYGCSSSASGSSPWSYTNAWS